MRDSVCLQCRAKVDRCWRWCPECGSQALLYPEGSVGPPSWDYDDFSVEWEIDYEDVGRVDGRRPVGTRS